MSGGSASATLASCQVIGFDMDHTIIRYRQVPFGALIHRGVADFLVRQKQYDAALLDVQFDARAGTKGIVLDKQYGNFLKIDHSARVVQARLGQSRWLSPSEVAATYGDHPLPEFDGGRTVRWYAPTS